MKSSEAMGSAEALRRLAGERDRRAWAALLERHGAEILRLARRVLDDAALAEDACQETLLQIRERAGQFRGAGPGPDLAARGWILRLAGNVALQMMRQRRRSQHRDEEHLRRKEEANAAWNAPEEDLMNDERSRSMRRELARMSEQERLPIVLHYYGGLGYAQLASTLDCPVGTAKARVHRGVEKLRQRLALMGLVLSLTQLSQFLEAADVRAADAALPPSAGQMAQWQSLLDSSRKPALPARGISQGGLSTMAKVSLSAAVLFLAGTLAFLASRSNGADQSAPGQPARAKAPGGQAVKGLQLVLSADKKKCPPGGPLHVALRLVNRSRTPIPYFHYPFPGKGASVYGPFLQITGPDGKPVRRRMTDLPPINPAPLNKEEHVKTLAPGTSIAIKPGGIGSDFVEKKNVTRIAWHEEVLRGRGLTRFGWDIRKPGRYTLRATYGSADPSDARLIKQHGLAVWRGHLASNTVTFEVAGGPKPSGEQGGGKPASKATTAEKKAAVRGNTAFAFDLYAKLKAEKGNLFFSPYSISTALAMTYAGARGNTAAQMAKVLRFPFQNERLHAAFAALIKEQNAKEPGKKRPYELTVANRLWGQQGYHFLPAFLNLTKSYYGAGLQEVNFKKATEKARQTINAWVEKQTQEKIKELIQKGILTSDTRLVLTNAIYFKGAWEHPFGKESTRNAPFHLASGKQAAVPMMEQGEQFKYMEEKGRFQAVELPYKGKNLAMTIFLPDKALGLAALEKDLMPEKLKAWTSRLKKDRILVYLPRFKMTWKTELSKKLMAMGMTDAFQYGPANFSGMDGSRELYISKVIHKAFVEVNELGTEAAAATAVGMSAGGMRPRYRATFRADRPFLFLIRDTRRGSVLFLGRVTDPRGKAARGRNSGR